MPGPGLRSYMICTSPRSGSTLLCGLLRDTGLAGNPASLFHSPDLAQWVEDNGLSDVAFASREAAIRAVLDRVGHVGRGGTEIFGLRMQAQSFPYFRAQLAQVYPEQGGSRAQIEAAFGPTLFIHLTRADKPAQAISRLIAEQSGLWHRNADGSELERLGPGRPLRYDREAIAGHVRALEQADQLWQDWFQAEGIAPLTMSYEALSEDPRGQVARVLGALGVAPEVAQRLSVPTARLADLVNADWLDRFRAELVC